MTIGHYFPKWHERMRALPDPRNLHLITYSISHLISLGLSMFCCQCGSRRQLREDRQTAVFRDNLNQLSAEVGETVADPDTMNYCMERMPPQGLELYVSDTSHQLIRTRALERFRLDGDYLVVVDGSRLFSYTDWQHCDQCLHTTDKKSGVTTYFHSVLEAKLVSREGLAISLASAFIENPTGDYDKQECELRTFYEKLAPKLKKRYPRLRICLLLDALYANENVLRLCRQNGWSYFIVFKKGSLPNLYAEAKRRIRQHGQQRVIEGTTYSWAHYLQQGKETTHAVFAQTPRQQLNGTQFGYLTDHRPSAENTEKLVNEGGRLRWKIENEGFNTQKTGGFDLEHDYGRKGFAWKNYYFLVQLAHMLVQLILNTDLFGKLVSKTEDLSDLPTGARASCRSALAYYKTLKGFARRLTESFRMQPLSSLGRDPDFPRQIQIRFVLMDTY